MAIGRIPEPLAGIQEAILDAKGDLISATAADTPARLAVGSNNQILMADSAQSTGLKWAASATSTLTAKGDLLTATAANTIARLGVGADGTTLVADSAQSTGLKWATASGGDMVKVASGSFSAASTITVDNCFTSTYKRYVVYATWGASAAAATRIQLRYGSTTETGNYYGSGFQYARNNTLTTYGSNPTSGNIPLTSGTGAYICEIVFGQVGTGSSAEAGFYGNGIANNFQEAFVFSGKADVARDYTGFLISGASGTFTGSYSVYGLKD